MALPRSAGAKRETNSESIRIAKTKIDARNYFRLIPMTLKDRKAPEFQLKDVDGRTHSLADGFGHWQLLVFHRHLG